MHKLEKGQLPPGHSWSDFLCFGPVTSKDGEFVGTMMCDMGCFKQDEVDSNKYYFAAIVQSKLNSGWYAYFQFGRVGGANEFQFFSGTKEEIQEKYEDQLHSKNDKRGEWYDHAVLGRKLRAKAGKDCYLVRQLTSRSVNIQTANNITNVKTAGVKGASASKFDNESDKLLCDLGVGAVSYTRAAMSNDTVPSKDAIDEGRKICFEASRIIKGVSLNTQLQSSELKELSYTLYSRIPKKTGRGGNNNINMWMLTEDNIKDWMDDLDAYENALVSTSYQDISIPYNFELEYIGKNHTLYPFIIDWFSKATRNAHAYIRKHSLLHIWSVLRHDDIVAIKKSQERISNELQGTDVEKPRHQFSRKDLTDSDLDLYNKSSTALLFHGTRSVNVSGILRESLKLPKYLSGIKTNGSLFGPGVYWADDWKKSAGYISSASSHWAKGSGTISGRGAFMFMGDVVLGKPYVTPRYSQDQPPAGFHSVFGKGGNSSLQNNEFVVYFGQQFNLRYLIELNIE